MATINQFISALNLDSNSMELTNSIKESLNLNLNFSEDFFAEDDEDEDDEDEYVVRKTSISFFPWEETNRSLENLFESLEKEIQENILRELNLPETLPHPWVGKAVVKLFSDYRTKTKTIRYLYSIGWSIDNLRKLKNPIDIVNLNKDLLKRFFQEHHINVSIRLLETATKDKQTSQEVFTPLVKEWEWILENHPDSLKGIRVRDIFSYYRELKKLKIQLEPSYELPIDKVLKAKVGPNFESYSVIFPTESKDLKWWGEKLNHCVGGYGEAVLKGACSIISLNQGEIPIYTIEVRKTSDGYEVPQFMGYNNSPAPEELVEKFKLLI